MFLFNNLIYNQPEPHNIIQEAFKSLKIFKFNN